MTTTPKLYTAGMSIESNLVSGKGSIGGFAQDGDGHPVIVSCSHVLFPGFKASPKGHMYSPDYSTCCGGEPIARSVYKESTPADEDGQGGWYGGYHDGTWTGGFNWIPARVNVNGSNVPGHASETDCAIARLDPGVKFANVWQIARDDPSITVPLKGVVSGGLGIRKGPAFGTPPAPNQYLRVFSAVRGQLQFGTVLSTAPDISHFDDPDHLIYRYGIGDVSDAKAGIKPTVNQFIFLPRPTPNPKVSFKETYQQGEELTIEGGQSGSFVINSDNEIVAMISRAIPPSEIPMPMDALELSSVRAFGIATPIAKVLSMLNVTIPSVPGGWSGTAPAAGPTRFMAAGVSFGARVGDDAAAATRRRAAARLRDELRLSVRGRLLLGMVGAHRHEVVRLLTTVRPVAAAWRALGGAAFHHHCLRSVERAGHRIPTNINGVGRRQLVETMAALLARYGSDALRRDLDRYGALFTEALLDIESIMDVPRALARVGART